MSGNPPSIAVIGAGPAGLMAAEVMAMTGLSVTVYDAMPSAGRKLLRAGIGGLNLTHAEPLDDFLSRYGDRRDSIAPLLAAFGPEQLLSWAHGLGIDTFVGSSQRIFPTDKKAAPLLRAWLRRLREAQVQLRMRWRWTGWEDPHMLRFDTAEGVRTIRSDAVVLALGGASWPQLGSDGSWVPLLEAAGVAIAPLQPSNCGFEVNWSDHFRDRYDRAPIKSVRARLDTTSWQSGELMVTGCGLEGGLLYALSGIAREQVATAGSATLWLDLAPGRSVAQLAARLSVPQEKRSLARHLRGRVGIDGVKAGLLREFGGKQLTSPQRIAELIKELPVPLGEPFPIARAISSAGGVTFDAMGPDLMLQQLPDVFCAGEMLDWEAPTGGYLLTACLASGFVAGQGVVSRLAAGTKPASPASAP